MLGTIVFSLSWYLSITRRTPVRCNGATLTLRVQYYDIGDLFYHQILTHTDTHSPSLFLTLYPPLPLSLTHTHIHLIGYGTIIHLFHTYTLVHNNMDYVYYICHQN